jgi:hypothetical protein
VALHHRIRHRFQQARKDPHLLHVIRLLLVAGLAELGVPAAHRVILAIGIARSADLKGILRVGNTVSTVGTTADVLTVEVTNFRVLESKGIPVSITMRLVIADDHVCGASTE